MNRSARAMFLFCHLRVMYLFDETSLVLTSLVVCSFGEILLPSALPHDCIYDLVLRQYLSEGTYSLFIMFVLISYVKIPAKLLVNLFFANL